jgi:hypothetical protein
VASKGGEFSTFVDSKIEGLPPTPGSLLSSPILPQLNPSPMAVSDHAESLLGAYQADASAPIQMASFIPPVQYADAEGDSSACP